MFLFFLQKKKRRVLFVILLVVEVELIIFILKFCFFTILSYHD
jgi:hypothetical protein